MPSPTPKRKLPWLPFIGPKGDDGPIGIKGIPGQSGGYYPLPGGGGVGGGGHGGSGGGASPPPPSGGGGIKTVYNYTGDYKSNFAYNPNDIVQYANVLWLCIKSNDNNVPNPNSICWQQIGGRYIIVNSEMHRNLWI